MGTINSIKGAMGWQAAAPRTCVLCTHLMFDPASRPKCGKRDFFTRLMATCDEFEAGTGSTPIRGTPPKGKP